MTAPTAVSGGDRAVGDPVQPCPLTQHWVQIQLVDESGEPVRGVRYEIEAPDGSVFSDVLDDDGMGGYPQIPAGQCTVRFPELDGAAWELKRG